MLVEELALRHPQLFHVTRAGAVAGIRRHGLMSTSGLLKLLNVPVDQRDEIESRPRATDIDIAHPLHGEVVLPARRMAAGELRAIDKRVFFWTSEESARCDITARERKDVDWIVLVFDTLSLGRWYPRQIEIPSISPSLWRATGVASRDTAFASLESIPHDGRRSGLHRRWIDELALLGGVDDVGLHLAGTIDVTVGGQANLASTRLGIAPHQCLVMRPRRTELRR